MVNPNPAGLFGFLIMGLSTHQRLREGVFTGM